MKKLFSILALLSTFPLAAFAQIVPEYAEPFHTVHRYSNINSEIVSRYHNGDSTLSAEEKKLAKCSRDADISGVYMVTHQTETVPLEMWLEKEQDPFKQGVILVTYNLPIGKTTEDKVNWLKLYVDAVFNECMK